MQPALLILSLAFAGAEASDSMSTLVAKLQAERTRKAALIDQLKAKDMLEMAKQEAKEDDSDLTPVITREVEESENYLNQEVETIEDQISAAQRKIHKANALALKAQKMDTTLEGVTSAEEKAKLAKLTFESSFIEKEARKNSMRERDSNFVQLETGLLNAQKKELQAELKKKAELRTQEKQGLEATAMIMKQEAQNELHIAQSQHKAVEAVAQANEGVFLTGRPKHMAPKWMIEAQISEAKESHSENAEKILREKQELQTEKSYLWNHIGKKYTCASEHNQVKAIIIDHDKDSADCLEKQLDKYCLEPLRAPAMDDKMVRSLINKPEDCLVNGVDHRIPAKKRDHIASRWCSAIQVLQAVTAQPPRQQYFVLLEDNVKIDPVNFEEVIKGFADSYHHPWDLLQLDPHGKHNVTDRMEAWNGHPVYRNSRHGQYYGTSALVMKTSSAPQLLSKMMHMKAVPLDTLPTLINEKDGKHFSAVALKANIISAPKKSSLLQKQTKKCGVTQSGLAELKAMDSPAKQPMSLLQEPAAPKVAPLDFFAFEAQQGEQKANKNWENMDLTA